MTVTLKDFRVYKIVNLGHSEVLQYPDGREVAESSNRVNLILYELSNQIILQFKDQKQIDTLLEINLALKESKNVQKH